MPPSERSPPAPPSPVSRGGSSQVSELHRRTIEGVAALLRLLYERSGVAPPAPLDLLAANLIAHDNGWGLEEAASVTFRAADQSRLLVRMLGAPPPRAERRRA